MRLSCAVCAIVLVAAAGCAQQPTSVVNASGNQVIEPQAGLDAGHRCDLQFGVARVNALFSAINDGALSTALELFPQDGAKEFTNQPFLEIAPSIRRSVLAGHLLADADSDAATIRQEVGQVLGTLSGLHFVFTAPLWGRAGTVNYSPQGPARVREVDFGPVLWKATGPLLQRSGKIAVLGGGKIAVSCDTGHFIRVAVGPTTIE